MNEPYTEFSASLSIVWFEFAGFSRHSLRLYPFSRKQKNPTVLFSLPVLDIRQFVYFNSYKDFNLTFLTLRTKKLRRVESRRAETRRDETGRGGTRRLLRASDVSQSGLLIVSVQVWAWCTPLNAWRGTHSRLAIIQIIRGLFPAFIAVV